MQFTDILGRLTKELLLMLRIIISCNSSRKVSAAFVGY